MLTIYSAMLIFSEDFPKRTVQAHRASKKVRGLPRLRGIAPCVPAKNTALWCFFNAVTPFYGVRRPLVLPVKKEPKYGYVEVSGQRRDRLRLTVPILHMGAF